MNILIYTNKTTFYKLMNYKSKFYLNFDSTNSVISCCISKMLNFLDNIFFFYSSIHNFSPIELIFMLQHFKTKLR